MANTLYNDSDYPVIASKLDPLLVRVNKTLLVVGDSSFSAKIKIGTMYTGFYVHTTAIGEPIASIAVDISKLNNKDIVGTTEHTAAYNYIEEQATIWMDNLEQSFKDASSQKNIVDLLTAIWRELHKDFTGVYTEDPSLDTTPSYLAKLNDIESLKTEVSGIKTQITNINTALGDIKTSIDSITNALGTGDNNFANIIADALSTGLEAIEGSIDTLDTDIDTVQTTLTGVDGNGGINATVNTISNDLTGTNGIKSTVDTIHTTDKQDIIQAVSSSSSTGAVNDLAGTVNSMNNTVNTINSNTNTIKTQVNKLDMAEVNRILCGDESAARHDSTKGWYFRTELYKNDMLVQDENDDWRVRATTD